MGELVDAALVAAADEIGVEEGRDAGLGHFDADQARAKRDGVGVVMLAGERCRQRLGDLRAAAGRVAVGGDRDADPRAANGDPALGPAIGQGLGEHRAVTADNRRFRGRWCRGRAPRGPARASQPASQVLEVDAGMIGGEGDAHDRLTKAGRRIRQPVRDHVNGRNANPSDSRARRAFQ